LKDLTEQQKRIHEQQTDLEMMLGEYPLIEELKLFIAPFEELWKLQAENIIKMKSWKQDSLSKLSPDDIEADFKKMQSVSTKLYGRFDNMKLPKPRDLANQVKEGLMKFRPTLPIIRALCNPGLQERHKIELGKAIFGVKKLADGTETCEQMFIETELTSDELTGSLGALGKKDFIEEISEKATKEFSNEKAMTKMRDEWEPLEFMAITVPGKDSYILSGESVELIQTALDDHIIKTQTMKGSPFAKFMLDKIVQWETVLLRT
jgi:dynein heavy chain, axonemal